MILMTLLVLRAWSVGTVILWIFVLKNAVFSPGTGTFWSRVRSLLLAFIWPVYILSDNGRRWVLETINLK